ncbi:MAG TPA: hypothetical protein VK470_16200 [Bacteroidota bacterium]|nr:hypothetical protein [Bacteroidota bacterium]
MKKLLTALLLAGCVSFLSAQSQVPADSPDLQQEFRKLHSTVKALQRAQVSQKQTYNILATRFDSLQQVLNTVQAQARQTNDSLSAFSKAQTEQASRIDSVETSLDMRTALLIVALVAIGALSLVIFFTLKKAIVEASEIILEQTAKLKPAPVQPKAQPVSAFIVESPMKRASVMLPIEPELFSPVEEPAAMSNTFAPAAPSPIDPVPTELKPGLHVAIAEMISDPERMPEAPAPTTIKRARKEKTTGQCQGVTKSGARCKRKAAQGMQYCTQHAH